MSAVVMCDRSSPLTSPHRRASSTVLRWYASDSAGVDGMDTPAQNRAWAGSLVKHSTGELRFVPLGSQPTTSKRPSPNLSS